MEARVLLNLAMAMPGSGPTLLGTSADNSITGHILYLLVGSAVLACFGVNSNIVMP